MNKEINTSHSLFKNLNEREGIMLCGYEWGDSKEDQKEREQNIAQSIDYRAECTFSDKHKRYGEKARTWAYDKRIKKWFNIFGHPLDEENPKDFDKCIIQTNWCNTQNNHIDDDIYCKLRDKRQVDNFIYHIKIFNPKIIIFLGSAMIQVLQDKNIKKSFMDIVGKEVDPLKLEKNQEFDGKKFTIGFQKFEKCTVISFPHPSGSRGLSGSYIAHFVKPIDEILKDYRQQKGI